MTEYQRALFKELRYFIKCAHEITRSKHVPKHLRVAVRAHAEYYALRKARP